MKKRLILLGFMVIIAAGLLFVKRSASAGITCNYTPPPVFSNATATMVNGGSATAHYPGYQNFDAPQEVKNCLQNGINSYPGTQIFSTVWLPDTVYGSGFIPITVSGALLLTSAFPGPATNVSLDYIDSYAKDPAGTEIPGTRGTNLVNFSRNADTLGSLDPNWSKGATQGALLDSSKLTPGLNYVCVVYNFRVTYNGSVITSATGPGDWCTTINYPSDRYDNQPSVCCSATALPGDIVNFSTQVQNVDTGDSPALQYDALNPNSAYFTPDNPLAQQSGTGFKWTGQPGPVGGGTTAPLFFGFKVGLTTPPGSYCTVVQISPAAGQSTPSVTVTTATRQAQACVTVLSVRSPYLTTAGGDVHAGGGIATSLSCAAGTGNVIGQTAGSPAPTQVQYVVSAIADISHVTAGVFLGNAPPVGYYGKVCRPDLDRAVSLYPAAKKAGFSTLAAAPSGFIMTAGPTAGCTHIPAGSISTLFTLYVTGNACLDGNITYNPAAVSAASLPGFGLIATGNIYIAPGVARLDGYYFAGSVPAPGNGVIDTCNTNGIPVSIVANAGACSSHLDVYGMMMGNSFRFARTGAAVSGTVETEKVNFLGDLFLAPPPAFKDVTSQRATQTRYQGEHSPLY